MSKHVAVLMGGLSAERPVSLWSGAACATALEGQGYRVSRVDVGRDLAQALTALKPDVAFNALHGRFGEDGVVQGPLIDMAGVEKVEEHIADAIAKGAKVALGGQRHALGGTFFQPTILTRQTQQKILTNQEVLANARRFLAYALRKGKRAVSR